MHLNVVLLMTTMYYVDSENANAHITAIDIDPGALSQLATDLSGETPTLTVVSHNFDNIRHIVYLMRHA